MFEVTNRMYVSRAGMQNLVTMSRFYRITVEELLERSLLMGLDQAEHIMVENEARSARIEAAIRTLPPFIDANTV